VHGHHAQPRNPVAADGGPALMTWTMYLKCISWKSNACFYFKNTVHSTLIVQKA
jgi:hypothetical protein